MLFPKTNNKNIINIFSILCEVIIGFGVFSIFFGIFMTYYFTEYETDLVGKFINKSISFYKMLFPNSENISSLINQLINKLKYKKQLENNISLDNLKISIHNKPYDDLLMKFILYMILGLLILLLLPILLGIIRIEQISFKYIGFSIFLHFILIVGSELIFLLFITSYINPVKLYTIFQLNKQLTNTYI